MANSRNILTVVIIVAVAGLIVALFIFFGGSSSGVSSGLQVQLPPDIANQNLSRELLVSLSSLKDLKLDPAFFKDPAFISLIDYSKDIVDEPIGRANPFLPVGPSATSQ